MTDKELIDRIERIEKKIERTRPFDDQLLSVYKSMVKRRNALVSSGCTVEMLGEVDAQIGYVVPLVNSIKKARAAAEIMREELNRRDRIEQENKYAEEQAKRAANPFNMKCKNFTISDGEPLCDAGMELTFCSSFCPYSSNNRGHYVLDEKGNVKTKVVVYRKAGSKWMR